jgi:hypothetical protein
MNVDERTLHRIDGLEDIGRSFFERSACHGAAVMSDLETCNFEKWRRDVLDLLYTLEGCEDIYYQRFSKEIVRPHMNDLERGLRILAAVRDDTESELLSQIPDPHAGKTPGSRPSVSYH